MDPKTDPNKNDQFKTKNFNLKSYIITCPIKNRKESMHKTMNYKKFKIVHVKKKNHILFLEQVKRTLLSKVSLNILYAKGFDVMLLDKRFS
jgi:hypothetical protein